MPRTKKNNPATPVKNDVMQVWIQRDVWVEWKTYAKRNGYNVGSATCKALIYCMEMDLLRSAIEETKTNS
jgi:hypothetical protein